MKTLEEMKDYGFIIEGNYINFIKKSITEIIYDYACTHQNNNDVCYLFEFNDFLKTAKMYIEQSIHNLEYAKLTRITYDSMKKYLEVELERCNYYIKDSDKQIEKEFRQAISNLLMMK